jgi:hypothetical protein
MKYKSGELLNFYIFVDDLNDRITERRKLNLANQTESAGLDFITFAKGKNTLVYSH